MRPLIVELVTFRAPPGSDWDAILADACAVIPRWRANPELVRKHFLLSDDGQECGGLYVWPNRAAAEAAHDAAWLPSRNGRVRHRRSGTFGCRCCSNRVAGCRHAWPEVEWIIFAQS
jgi:hypothetical protein